MARQLVRNLLYHDVLSSSSSKHGLLLDYSSLRSNGTDGATPASSKNSTTGLKENDEELEDGEDEEVLDTLMGVAERKHSDSLILSESQLRIPYLSAVFLLIGKITSLAREKHDATKRNGGMIPEEELADFLRKIDEVRARLELEKARVDSFVVGEFDYHLSISTLGADKESRSPERPDLEPHRYFHEVFRLAALLYLQMVSEVPPRAYPVLLLVRKMLSLYVKIFLHTCASQASQSHVFLTDSKLSSMRNFPVCVLVTLLSTSSVGSYRSLFVGSYSHTLT